MEFEEEPGRRRDEDTEEQTDSMDVNGAKHHGPRDFKNEDEKAVVSKTEENVTQKQAGRSEVKEFFIRTECGKCYMHKSDLKRLMRIHTGVNLFTCTQCEKSFKRKSVLKNHLRSHSGLRSFSCDQCEKTLVLASSLRAHIKVHVDVKPHVCSPCGKSFSELYSLKQHERVPHV